MKTTLKEYISQLKTLRKRQTAFLSHYLVSSLNSYASGNREKAKTQAANMQKTEARLEQLSIIIQDLEEILQE